MCTSKQVPTRQAEARSMQTYTWRKTMVENNLVTMSWTDGQGMLPGAEERQAALAISPLFARVDDSVLWVIIKIFASANDGRVVNACLFLAHFLRISMVDQRSLFPNTEVCDVAVVALPSVRALSILEKEKYQWPYCYETTLKYFGLLVAAGVFLKPRVKRGNGVVYHFPLGIYTLLPEHAGREVAKLAKKRARVSRSNAYQRVAVHCSLEGISSAPGEAPVIFSSKVGSLGPEFLAIDILEVQRVAQAISESVQRHQQVALLPAALLEIARVVSEHTLRVKKSSSLSNTQWMGDSPGYRLAAGNMSAADDQQTIADSNGVESAFAGARGMEGSPDGAKNLQSFPQTTHEAAQESTSAGKNPRTGQETVDSSHSPLTDSLISLKKDSLSDISEFTIGGQLRRREAAQESTISADGAQIVDSISPDERQVTRYLPDLDEDDILAWARCLSEWFVSQDGRSRVGHYRKMLRQSPATLHVAIVDAMVRSLFPDPDRNPAALGGGWVTDRYRGYYSGRESVPTEIFAWSQTGLSYDELQMVLEAEAARQVRAGMQRRQRPFPEDLIVDSTSLRDFWLAGGAEGLEDQGYLYVDVNCELLPCQEYQALRRHNVLALAPGEPEADYEIATYLHYQEPWFCDRERAAKLLENSPSLLTENVRVLEDFLGQERYAIEVVVTLSGLLMIEVSDRNDPRNGWLLRHKKAPQAFIEAWERGRQVEREGMQNTEERSADAPPGLEEFRVDYHGGKRRRT